MLTVEPREAYLVEVSTGSDKRLGRLGLGSVRYYRKKESRRRRSGKPSEGTVLSLVK